jgi:hypothetical protein
MALDAGQAGLLSERGHGPIEALEMYEGNSDRH